MSDPTNGLAKLLSQFVELTRDPLRTVSMALLLTLVALIALIFRL